MNCRGNWKEYPAPGFFVVNIKQRLRILSTSCSMYQAPFLHTIGSQYLPFDRAHPVRYCNMMSLPIWTLLYAAQWLISCIPYRNDAVSKVLYECYKLATALLKSLFVLIVDDLPLEANLFQSIDPFLWEAASCWFQSILDFIVWISHSTRTVPLAQWRVNCIPERNITVSKLLFEWFELKEVFFRSLVVVDGPPIGSQSLPVDRSFPLRGCNLISFPFGHCCTLFSHDCTTFPMLVWLHNFY